MALVPILLLVLLIRDATAFGPLRDLLFPSNPVLTRVRTPKEAEAAEASGSPGILDFVGLVEQHGYRAEEHTVTTEDGYILKLHRISDSPNLNTIGEKSVVFMMNGLFFSADMWVLRGPQSDLAYLLADNGYDVWIGNYRGSTYGRSHLRLSPSDSEFWDYGFTEHGLFDVRAMIDHALIHSGKDRLQYIGHSLGGTSIYVLLSTIPEYNEKVSLVVGLAPAGFFRHQLPLLQNTFFSSISNFKDFLARFGIHEIMAQTDTTVSLARTVCNPNNYLGHLCNFVLYIPAAGFDSERTNYTQLPHLLSYFPCGTSTKLISHCHQMLYTDGPAYYDYGKKENMRIYGQETPPQFDTMSISVPMVLLAGGNDGLVAKADVVAQAKNLPNVISIMYYPPYTHMDFIWATDAKETIYKDLIQLMESYRD